MTMKQTIADWCGHMRCYPLPQQQDEHAWPCLADGPIARTWIAGSVRHRDGEDLTEASLDRDADDATLSLMQEMITDDLSSRLTLPIDQIRDTVRWTVQRMTQGQAELADAWQAIRDRAS